MKKLLLALTVALASLANAQTVLQSTSQTAVAAGEIVSTTQSPLFMLGTDGRLYRVSSTTDGRLRVDATISGASITISTSGPLTVTANQGTPGTRPWPVVITGTVAVSVSGTATRVTATAVSGIVVDENGNSTLVYTISGSADFSVPGFTVPIWVASGIESLRLVSYNVTVQEFNTYLPYPATITIGDTLGTTLPQNGRVTAIGDQSSWPNYLWQSSAGGNLSLAVLGNSTTVSVFYTFVYVVIQ